MSKQSENLMKLDNEIWDRFDFGSGSDVEKHWSKYLKAVDAGVTRKVSAADMRSLEWENHHSMIQALIELGKGPKQF